MDEQKTLLDWHAEKAEDLAVMRANTARWVKDGLLKTPGEVRVRAGKAMSVNPWAKVRKARAG